MTNYGIRSGYTANLQNLYYNDEPDNGIIWQPDVYEYAIAFAREHKIPNIIDIGSGNGEKLERYKDEFTITFIDFGANLDTIRSKFKASRKKHRYVDQNFEKDFPKLEASLVQSAVVICSDVIEHIRDFACLTTALVDYSTQAKLLLISTPERYRMYGFDQSGPPLNKCHVREWRLEELEQYFESKGMRFSIGLTRTNDRANQRATICIVSGTAVASSPMEATDIVAKRPGYLTKVVAASDLASYLDDQHIAHPKFPKTVLGLVNVLDGDYFLNHYLRALTSGSAYVVNHFKFVNSDAERRYYNAGVENIDRLLVQYVRTTKHGDASAAPYPISFTFLHNASFKTPANRPLLTLAVEQLRVQYLPELILGFHRMKQKSETLTLMPDQAQLAQELVRANEALAVARTDNDRLQQRVGELERELRHIYTNPAYYVAKGGKKLFNKTRKRVN